MFKPKKGEGESESVISLKHAEILAQGPSVLQGCLVMRRSQTLRGHGKGLFLSSFQPSLAEGPWLASKGPVATRYITSSF